MVKPATGLTEGVEQIYPIVNDVYQQMTGQKDIEAVDTNSLVAMGTKIQNTGKLDIWLNTLNKRIGRTINNYRAYRNKFASLYRSQLEWGALVQKITVEMPDAVMDDTVDVGKMDGQSIDQYIINNPKVHQKLFDKETPYSFFVTIQTKWVKEAFLSAGAMQALINQIFGKVQNKQEFVLEELARLAVVNFIVNLAGFQEFHLVSMYNSTAPAKTVTSQSARFDQDFLRYAIGVINNVSKKMETMSVLYNSDGFERFTPAANQNLYMLSDFMTTLQTQVSYAAFNPQYVTANPDILVPYWQAAKSAKDATDWNTISAIAGSGANGKEVKKNNLIGILFDYDAIGTFREEEDVLTTPVNARAAYYNTFWHENQLWFNDMSENGVAFYLD